MTTKSFATCCTGSTAYVSFDALSTVSANQYWILFSNLHDLTHELNGSLSENMSLNCRERVCVSRCSDVTST